MCDRVREWVLAREPEEVRQVVEALQIRIDAQTEGCEMAGVIPEGYASVDCHADVRAVVSTPRE